MKKIVALSSVVLGVVFLAGCGQQQTSQTQPTAPVVQRPVATQPEPTDETANWQTYSNTQLGFEVKFPQKNWIKWEDSADGGVFFNGTKKIDTNSNRPYMDSSAGIRIYSIDNPKNNSIQDLFNENYDTCLKAKSDFGCAMAENVSTWKSITVGGFPAFRSGMRPIPEGIPNDDVYIKISNKYIVLQAFSSPNNDQLDIEPVFDKIISTLKFTN